MVKAVYRFAKRALRDTYYFLQHDYYSIVGGSVRCNICGFTAGHLVSDSWHRHSICPRCGSAVRQRLLWQMLLEHSQFNFSHLIKGKDVLHFAPERVLREKIRKQSATYRSADSFAPGYDYPDIDLNLDIADMHAVPDNSVDCLIAMDVLEHVRDDRKALSEILRVLRPGGHCLLTVPQRDHAEKTESDTGSLSPEERERRFGQADHYRIYGSDFRELMDTAGLETTPVDETFLPQETVRKHVLFPPERSPNPLATNFRKVYVGRKPIAPKV